MDRAQLLNDPEESMRLALEGNQAGIWTAMPAIVQTVDFSKMTLSAQPAIQGTIENEDGSTSSVNMPLLVDVPICFPSAGGFTLTLPIKAGDEVLVIFASRCIDSWWQNSGVGRPMEMRMHDLSDGFALPGPRSVPKVITNISTTGAQLRNDSGATYLEISASGQIKLMATAGITITGPVTVTGAMAVTGAVTVTGALAATSMASSSIVANGINLSNHRHNGVATGGGTSGGPV